MLACKKCSFEVPDSDDTCPTCGSYAGAPNVRAAGEDREVQALLVRYGKAIQQAKAERSEIALSDFEKSMAATVAVINVHLDFLYQFITNDKLIYTNYELSVKGQARKPAKVRDDRHRRSVGAMLFGKYAEEIRYAALSVDGSGLASWGSYAIKLTEIAIIDRTSLLEDNSYNFIPKHKIESGGEIPPGFISTWPERHKLAVAKLSRQISKDTKNQDHSEILLSNTGNRERDDYIEVHVYGGFDNKAIESVKGGSAVKGKWEEASISIVKERLSNTGRMWLEE
jgi:hypothetical protein